jgi:hypothetical protein
VLYLVQSYICDGVSLGDELSSLCYIFVAMTIKGVLFLRGVYDHLSGSEFSVATNFS